MAPDAELEINQDLDFQRREWLVQRVGWWALATFVAVAALGLFGGGPLSRARAGDRGGPLWVEYERFVRVGARTRIYVHGSPGAAGSSGSVQVRISRRYFDAVRIERMTPEPAGVDVGPANVDLRFDAAALGHGVPMFVIDLQPQRAGRLTATLATNQGSALTFTQFAYF